MGIIDKLTRPFKRNTYYFYDQETGDGTILELKGDIRGGIMQIEVEGKLIDIQIKNIYKLKHECRVNYIQLNKQKDYKALIRVKHEENRAVILIQSKG